jgi:hypothetical protein
MSLQLLAKQMEAKGRDGDSVLVHMTPGEVEGLQKLAESAGGSLTVNPETGLVEANFLKRMLPTLIGIGLGATGIGALGAAALVGGGTALATGDMKKGLMAGLGAAGGAGIGSGLSAAGSTAAQGAAMGTEATAQGAAAQGATAVPGAAATAAPVTSSTEALAQYGITPTNSPLVASAPPVAPQVAPVGTEAGAEAIKTQAAAADAQFKAQNVFSKTGQGIQSLGEQGSRDAFMADIGGGSGLAKSVGMSAVSSMEPPKPAEEVVEDDEMYYTEYTPGQTGERSSTSTEARQFSGGYSPMERIKADDYMARRNRRYAAEGGLMRLAEGGATNAAPAGTSGASADAMSYLMGQAPSSSGAPSASQAGLQYLMGQTSQSPVMQAAAALQAQLGNFVAPERGFGDDISDVTDYTEIKEGPNAGMYQGEAKFAFDPASQKYYRTDKLFKYVPPPTPEPDTSYGAAGGLVGLAKGGMKSGGFVIPADVVSMVGEGNTDAGYSRIKSMVPGATAIKGKDGGQADTVKTSIEGKQPARVAHGEMYIPPETVKRMGGAKKLYAMMDRVRDQATGSKKQIKPVSLKRALA